MPSRRRRDSGKREGEISDVIVKLQAFLPKTSSKCTSKVPASKILKETCSYIKSLHREAGDLSERLAQLLASVDSSGVDAEILRG